MASLTKSKDLSSFFCGWSIKAKVDLEAAGFCITCPGMVIKLDPPPRCCCIAICIFAICICCCIIICWYIIACICSGDIVIIFAWVVGDAMFDAMFLRGSNESFDGVVGAATATPAVGVTAAAEFMNPKADPAAAGGDVRAGLGWSAPVNDKLSNMLAAPATGGMDTGVGLDASGFMNPKADFGSAGAAADGIAGDADAAPTDIKSRKLSLAAGAGGAATGAAARAGAILKPPKKFPSPVAVAVAVGVCGGFGGDCWGGGGGAAGAGASGPPVSKSNKLTTGTGAARGAATGAAARPTGGIAAPPTGVATPKKFKTRLAGSRMAARE